MANFESAQSAVRLTKIRQMLKHGPMTVSEVAAKLGMSKQLTAHYIRHMRDQDVVKEMGVKSIGAHNAPATLWGLVVKPAPKPKASKPQIINRHPRDVQTLTNWIGGNPFERLTA